MQSVFYRVDGDREENDAWATADPGRRFLSRLPKVNIVFPITHDLWDELLQYNDSNILNSVLISILQDGH